MLHFILFGFAVPVFLALVWVLWKRESMLTVLVGAGTFALFSQVLEQIPIYYFYSGTTEVSRMVLNNTVLYMVLGASLAGIFEEIGRWVAFRYFLKAKTKKETAISYGIGHGGAEIILLIGVPFLVMLLMPELREQVGSISYGWVMLERISAMLFHLGMSILVFCGVHQKGKGWYVLLAIFLHAGFDLFAAAYQVGVLTNVPLVEGILFVISMVVFWTMYGLLYRKNTSQEMEC